MQSRFKTHVRPVCVLHTESSPSLGGQELRVLLEMEVMQARGVTSVLAARPDTPILREARTRGLTAYAVPMRFNLDPLSLWQIRKIIRQHQIQIVNAHNSKDGWNVLPVARLMGLKTIRARHIANRVRAGIGTRLIYDRWADAVMTTARSIGNHIADIGIPAQKIRVIPTGIDPTPFQTATKGKLRSELGVPDTAPLIGQVSVLRGDKGPLSFIEAAWLAIQNGSPAWFVLVGDGPARQQAEARLAQLGHPPQIQLTGFRRDIPEIMADLDLFVLAAHVSEGVPQAILQAQAAQKPVLTTRCGGIDEVARHDVTAHIVPPRDPKALATAMQELLQNPERTTRLAHQGFKQLQQHHTLTHMIDQMENLYRSLLQANG